MAKPEIRTMCLRHRPEKEVSQRSNFYKTDFAISISFGESSPNSLVFQAAMRLGQLSGIARVSVVPIKRSDQKSSPKMPEIEGIVTLLVKSKKAASETTFEGPRERGHRTCLCDTNAPGVGAWPPRLDQQSLLWRGLRRDTYTSKGTVEP